MRTLGLLILLIFFPVFVHAAPPALTAYTLSHDIIYPAATAESGLATTTAIDVAFSERVKASIKIMSANGAMVKSLYSSSGVINPERKIWDGTNDAKAQVVSGTYTILISATSTATDLSMTNSSKTVTVASSDSTLPDTSSDVTSTDAITPSATGGPAEYLPIPVLRILSGGDRTISSGADTAFTAAVYDGKGNKRDDATVTWSFGDGMRRTGANVFHAYYDPGEYLVVVHASTPDGGDTLDNIVVTVKDARVRIVSVSSRGIALMNSDSRSLDLSLWRLSMGGKEFKIPADTQILTGRTILFPVQVIDLPVTGSALLLYPSGEVAASYPEATAAMVSVPLMQPSVLGTSFNKIQKVDPIISAAKNIQAHDEAVRAPTAATELAAVGAALPPMPPSDDNSSTSGIFRSPWTLGFLGVIILSAGAFIFL